LLDDDDIPFADIRQNMKELNNINTWLGGHAITCKGLELILKKHEPGQAIIICEIGCGGGDNLMALSRWCTKKNIDVQFIGIDIKPACIEFAKQQCAGLKADWIASDYLQSKFSVKPDIIFSSLFCHHFSESELCSMLRWMQKNCTKGFFINDLHRHLLAYYSIKLITRLFSKSYLVKNDAPLSVARGFKKNEWQTIFMAAEIKRYTLSWQWAFRHLIIYCNE